MTNELKELIEYFIKSGHIVKYGDFFKFIMVDYDPIENTITLRDGLKLAITDSIIEEMKKSKQQIKDFVLKKI